MGLRDDLVDPWGGIVAGVAGGLAWAVASASTAAVPLGIGVAAVVYGAKVASSRFAHRFGDRSGAAGEPGRTPLPEPRRGSPAAQWLTRAQGAVRSLTELVDSPAAPDARAQLQPVGAEAADMVETMRRFAGQVTAVEDALTRVPEPRLRADRARLADAVAAAGSAQLRSERQRALASVDEQLAVAARLSDARDTLLARMQATVLGLEGLVARTAEVLALGASSGFDTSASRITELAGDLDGLRAGLAEAEEVSRRVLDPGRQ
ncbi:MAG TPA: hypothetical protein VMU51_09570 [Mycobacteriales bacterium]|nr:hypothetical protein [Mycobacteriales bacterium]